MLAEITRESARTLRKVLEQLTGALGIARKNLRAFDTYAMTDDPYRKAVIGETLGLEQGMSTTVNIHEARTHFSELLERAKPKVYNMLKCWLESALSIHEL